MAYGTRVAFENVREIAFSSIGASYTAVGSATIDHARLIRIVNQTDAQIYVSIDGTNNQIRMAANSFFLLDLTTNKVTDDGYFINLGTTFYVKQVSAAPTSGSLWIEVVYAQGGV